MGGRGQFEVGWGSKMPEKGHFSVNYIKEYFIRDLSLLLFILHTFTLLCQVSFTCYMKRCRSCP